MGGFTQDDGYVQGVAPMHDAPRNPSRTLLDCFWPNPNSSLYWVLDTDTGTGLIPPVTVSRVNAYSGGALARALPEGLRNLST